MTTSGQVGDYLDHILSAIERIERYTSELDEAAFLESELVQDAVIRNIEVSGHDQAHWTSGGAALSAAGGVSLMA